MKVGEQLPVKEIQINQLVSKLMYLSVQYVFYIYTPLSGQLHVVEFHNWDITTIKSLFRDI